ncbi:MAG: NYN domain-containing protein [Gammaproteobacteria bacterium]|nr:NYN domain-containing protein [Gammaproteobacteria bacterium]
MKKQKIKTVCLVDGYNLYHSVSNTIKSAYKGDKLVGNHLKWLDLHKLSQHFLSPQDELVEVYYFTAYYDEKVGGQSTNNQARLKRHQTYVSFLQEKGVKPIFGKFKKVTRTCKKCRKKYDAYEEKETDVNLSVKAVELLRDNEIDKLMIISADSDFMQPAKLWRKSPNKKIKFIVPHGLKSVTKDIQNNFSFSQIKVKHLKDSLLGNKIIDSQRNLLHRPNVYLPPEA